MGLSQLHEPPFEGTRVLSRDPMESFGKKQK